MMITLCLGRAMMPSRSLTVFGSLLAVASVTAGDPDYPPALSAGHFNVTSKNLDKLLKKYHTVLLGFSTPGCKFCRSFEPDYLKYVERGGSVPLGRVDSIKQKKLAAKYEIESLPAMVLVKGAKKSFTYTGLHSDPHLHAFVQAHVTPVPQRLPSLQEVQSVITSGFQGMPRNTNDVLLIGLFKNEGDEDEDDRADFMEAATMLRKTRTDAALWFAEVVLDAEMLKHFTKTVRWFERGPVALLFVGPTSYPRGFRQLDESADEMGQSLTQWVQRLSMPLAEELTPGNFQMYAASSMPMLILFVDPNVTTIAEKAENDRVRKALKAAAPEFTGKVVFVWCDGIKHKARKMSLGLRSDKLPAMAINTQDTREFPFPIKEELTQASIQAFVGSYLAERLTPGKLPSRPPRNSHSKPLKVDDLPNKKDVAAIVELKEDTFESIVMDSTKDVLVEFYKSKRCKPCDDMAIYYGRAAGRFRELEMDHVVFARLDMQYNKLPRVVSTAVHLLSLPHLVIFPAKDKQAPYTSFEGQIKVKSLMFFVKRYAGIKFELPVNPHLTRQQQEDWKVQVGALPQEKREKAYYGVWEDCEEEGICDVDEMRKVAKALKMKDEL